MKLLRITSLMTLIHSFWISNYFNIWRTFPEHGVFTPTMSYRSRVSVQVNSFRKMCHENSRLPAVSFDWTWRISYCHKWNSEDIDTSSCFFHVLMDLLGRRATDVEQQRFIVTVTLRNPSDRCLSRHSFENDCVVCRENRVRRHDVWWPTVSTSADSERIVRVLRKELHSERQSMSMSWFPLSCVSSTYFN